MISQEVEKTLILLERIERTISNIYGSLAVNDSFNDRAQRFWATMLAAELEHAALFRNIREEGKHDEATQIELSFDVEQLGRSYKKIKKIEKKVITAEISEKDAYSLGAFIEESLYEYSYSKRVTSNNQSIQSKIEKVEEDTRQHYILLHNYSLNGINSFRGP
jgi:hypothetical protein